MKVSTEVMRHFRVLSRYVVCLRIEFYKLKVYELLVSILMCKVLEIK